MVFNWSVFAGVLIFNALFAIVMAMLIKPSRNAPGSREAVWMFIALAVWAFAYAMITVSEGKPAKYFWLNVENIGIVSVPVFWFSFTTAYARMDRWLTRPVRLLVWVIPAVTLLLLFSGHGMTLYYTGAEIATPEGGPLIVAKGPWYWPQLVQTYLLIAVGMGVLIWYLFLHREIYRRRIALVIGAMAAPWLVNVFYQFASAYVPGSPGSIDLTAIAFTASATLIGPAIFNLRLFDIVPIARSIVLENIPEMVMVVDANHRILDANQAALKWIGQPAHHIIGNTANKVLNAWPRLASLYKNTHSLREEVNIPGDPSRTLEFTISPLPNRSGDSDGRIIVAHDITSRKQMELDLKAANEALTVKLAEIESLQAQLREQAIRDPLTGVYNRRYLAESLEGFIARAERENSFLSLVIMDVDFFKQFNDTYGHKCGDQVLEYLGSMLMRYTRRGDVVCRYGGEEFVVVMPDVCQEIAVRRADQWRETFQSQPLIYEGIPLTATFSAGVATYPVHGENDEAVLKAADKALYKSKANGRNMVTMSGTD